MPASMELQALLLPGDLFGIDRALSELVRVIAAIICFFALAECFFGYKLFRIWIAICGFFVFGALGTAAAYALSDKAGISVFVGILAAIAGAFIAYKLYLIGVFLSCGLMGFTLGYLLTEITWPGVVMGLVFGVLGVMFVKPVVILSTGISGGLLAGTTLVIAFGGNSRVAEMLLGLLLAAAGVYVQWVTNRKAPARAEAETAAGPGSPQGGAAGQAVDQLREGLLQVSRSIGGHLRERVERERAAALQQSSGFSAEQAFAIVAERLYANRVMQYLMPFAEIVLLALAIVSFIFSLRLFSILHSHFLTGALLAFFAGLCVAKRSYPVLGLSALIAALGKWIAFIKWITFPNFYYLYLTPSRYIVLSLVEALLMSAAAFFAVRAALRPDQVEALKDFGRRVRESLAGNRQHTVACPGCGAPNDASAKFCSACGAGMAQQQA